jgi:hypothetical protein
MMVQIGHIFPKHFITTLSNILSWLAAVVAVEILLEEVVLVALLILQ